MNCKHCGKEVVFQQEAPPLESCPFCNQSWVEATPRKKKANLQTLFMASSISPSQVSLVYSDVESPIESEPLPEAKPTLPATPPVTSMQGTLEFSAWMEDQEISPVLTASSEEMEDVPPVFIASVEEEKIQKQFLERSETLASMPSFPAVPTSNIKVTSELSHSFLKKAEKESLLDSPYYQTSDELPTPFGHSSDFPSPQQTFQASLEELKAASVVPEETWSSSYLPYASTEENFRAHSKEIQQEAEKLANEGKLAEAIDLYMKLTKVFPKRTDFHQRQKQLWRQHREQTALPTSSSKGTVWLVLFVVMFLLAIAGFYLFWKQSQELQTQSKISQLEPPKKADKKVFFSSISLVSNPSGAEVVVNGKKTGQSTPTTLKMQPGEVLLELHLKGFTTLQRKMEISANTNMLLELSLQPQESKSNPSQRKKKNRVHAKTGTLQLHSFPSGAGISMNGKKTGQVTPATLELTPGKYHFDFALKGYEASKRVFHIQRGQTYRINISLGSHLGSMDVQSKPSGFSVWIDGQKTAYKTPVLIPIAPGKRTIRLQPSGYNAEEKVMDVQKNQTHKIVFSMKRSGYDSMVYVSGGKFWMGNNTGEPQEKPMHEVYVSGFWMDQYEVSVEEYNQCVKEGNCSRSGKGRECNASHSDRQKHPINCVNWYQAKSYCKWKKKHLPTEAQWEKAAKSNTTRPYSWGFSQPTCSNAVFSKTLAGCGKLSTWPVGSKKAGRTATGLYDMTGNVWEWVRDYYSATFYENSPSKNPYNGTKTSGYRIVRGGSWKTNYDKLHVTYRSEAWPTQKNSTTGFRCAK